MWISGWRLALENQGLTVRVRSLAMFRGKALCRNHRTNVLSVYGVSRSGREELNKIASPAASSRVNRE